MNLKVRVMCVFAKLKWLTKFVLKGNLGGKSTRVANHKLVFMCKAVIKVLYLGRVHRMPEKFENAALSFYR